MTNLEKFWKAIMTIKPNVELTVNGDITSQEDFDNNIIEIPLYIALSRGIGLEKVMYVRELTI